MELRYDAARIILDAYGENMAMARDEDMEAWLLHKAAHSFAVAGIAEEITLAEAELEPLRRNERERENAMLGAILHDLGRLYQHRDGKRLKSSEFDHGKKAVELLAGMKRFDDPAILFAIDEHDSFKIDFSNPYYVGLPDDRKPAAMLAARLLRDADKLENIRNFRMFSGNRFSIGERSPLSARMREVIESGAPVRYADGSNPTDEAAGMLSWISDIEFEYTRGAVERTGFFEAGLELMKEQGATDGDVALVRARYERDE